MSIRAMQAVWEHSRQSGGALVLLLAIADNAHDDGDGAYPSVATLARKARMSERNVRLLLQSLAAAGEMAIVPGGGRGNTNAYRITLPGLANPENISAKPARNPEIFSVKEPTNPEICAGNPEIPGTETLKFATETLKPASAEPLVNQLTLTKKEPNERETRARVTLATYDPSPVFREKAATDYPWLDFDPVLDNWRDYHRAKGDAIKDFDASLRTWLRRERPPAGARASPNGRHESASEAKIRRSLEAIWGKPHGPADIQPQPLEAHFSLLRRNEPGAG
jgi:hypothetical protein